MPRKTFDVADLLEKANWFLRNSEPDLMSERYAYITIMDDILHATENYKGFSYVCGSEDVNFDYSRISFFIAPSLLDLYRVCEKKRDKDGMR